MNLIDKNIGYLERLLTPLKPYYKTIGKFPDWESYQGDGIAWYEMFARSTYGIFAYTAVKGDNEYVTLFNEIFKKVIADSRYNQFRDWDQKAVELLPLMSMLLIHKNHTWDTYTQSEKNQILNYFSHINQIDIGKKNWLFFRLVVSRGIKELGGSVEERCIKDSWNIIDNCYCGDGWYRDGEDGPKDYYIAFGYQYYSLLYRLLFPKDIICDTIKQRALEFAQEYQYFFDNEGRMIVYGRSMIYRYASLAFWSMLLCDESLSIELRKNAIAIIDKDLEWWKGQPITNAEGLMNLGIAYRNEYVCEAYNSSGSPYWAMKAFAFMLAPKSLLHIEEEETINHEIYPKIKTIANGDIIVARNKKWSTAYINSYKGADFATNNSAKYMRFAYNSMTGFNVSRSAGEMCRFADDNCLIFDIEGVKHLREYNETYVCGSTYQIFDWSCGRLIKVKSIIVPTNKGYLRVHVIHSKLKVWAYETGFAISDTMDEIFAPIILVRGVGRPFESSNEVNSNIYYHHTHMHGLKYRIYKGVTIISDYTLLNEEELECFDDENPFRVSINLTSLKIQNSQENIVIPLRFATCVRATINECKSVIVKKIRRLYKILK